MNSRVKGAFLAKYGFFTVLWCLNEMPATLVRKPLRLFRKKCFGGYDGCDNLSIVLFVTQRWNIIFQRHMLKNHILTLCKKLEKWIIINAKIVDL